MIIEKIYEEYLYMNNYCIVDDTVLCCECGNCPHNDEEDLYPFSEEE